MFTIAYQKEKRVNKMRKIVSTMMKNKKQGKKKGKLLAVAVVTGCMMLMSAGMSSVDVKAFHVEEWPDGVARYESIQKRHKLKEVTVDGVVYSYGVYLNEDGEVEEVYYYAKDFKQEYKKNGKAVYTNIKIKNEIKGYPVREIGEEAFEDEKDIKSVTFGKNMKLIGTDAFRGCKKLNDVTFSNNKQSQSELSIYGSAFDNTKISNKAKKKNALVVTEQNILINDDGFGENVTITGDAFKVIPGRLFAGNKTVKNISISNLDVIGEEAFLESSVKEVSVKNVGKIDIRAFALCNTDNVQIDGVNSMSDEVFAGDFGTVSIKNMSTWYTDSLDCGRIDSLVLSDIGTMDGGYSYAIVQSATIGNVKKITSTALQSIVIENLTIHDVKIIASHAFRDSSFKNILIKNVDNVGSNMLRMRYLGMMTFENVKTMHKNALTGSENSKDVKITKGTDGVIKVEHTDSAWKWEDVTMNGVVYEMYFEELYSTEMVMRVKSFEQKYNADKTPVYTDIVIPNKVNGYKVDKIGKNAFKNHPEINTVKMNSYIKTIEAGAFENCTGLSDVTFAKVDKLKDLSVAADAFHNTAIYNSAIAKGQPVVTSQKVLLSSAGFGKKVKITGKTVAVIPNGMFENNKKIKKLTVDGVTNIGANAFAGCKLNKVTVNNVDFIGEKVFAGSSLKKVTIKNVNKMKQESFANAKVINAKLTNVKEKGYAFKDADVKNVTFKGCDVDSYTLEVNTLGTAKFIKTSLPRKVRHKLTITLKEVKKGKTIIMKGVKDTKWGK